MKNSTAIIHQMFRLSWIAVLILTVGISLGIYNHFSHVKDRFVQNEIAHRSELLMHDIKEIIQQHIDATRGMSAYVYSELAAHQTISEPNEAEQLLRATLLAHEDELIQAAIFFQGGDSVVHHTDLERWFPPLSRALLPGLEAGQIALALIPSLQEEAVLRVYHSVCASGVCAQLVVDIAVAPTINHMLHTDGEKPLMDNMLVKVNMQGADGWGDLYRNSFEQHTVAGSAWHGNFELVDSIFSVETIAMPALRAYFLDNTASSANWFLAFGLTISLLMTTGAYNLTRYNDKLRAEVAKRTRRLSDEQKKLSAVIDSANDVILLMDEKGEIQRANRAAGKLFGYKPEEWHGLSVHALVPANIRESHGHWFAEEVGDGCHSVIGGVREVTAQCKDGNKFPAEVTVSEFRYAGVRRLSVILRDLTERKKAEERMVRLSYFDAVTGLPNRRLFVDRLRQILTLASREKRHVAVLSLDICRFKNINDTLGHAAGDLVLKKTGRRLASILRASDTAARMGGDEFSVLLPGADAEIAMHVAEKVIESLKQSYQIESREVALGVSVGIAYFPHDGSEADELLMHADTAMNHARKNALDVHCFSKEMEETIIMRMKMEQDLARALDENQLRLYFQSQHLLLKYAHEHATDFPLYYQSKH